MIGFTGARIDRADHIRLVNEKITALASSEEAKLLRLDGHDPVLGEDGRLAWDRFDAPRNVERIEGGIEDARAPASQRCSSPRRRAETTRPVPWTPAVPHVPHRDRRRD